MTSIYRDPALRESRLASAAVAVEQMRLMADCLMDGKPGDQLAAVILAVCERDPITFEPLAGDRSSVAMVFPAATQSDAGVRHMMQVAPLLCACGYASSVHVMSTGLVARDASILDKMGDLLRFEGEGADRKARPMADREVIVDRFKELGQLAVIVMSESDPWLDGGPGAHRPTALVQMHSRGMVRDEGRLRWSGEWGKADADRRTSTTSHIARGIELAASYSDAELAAMFQTLHPRTVAVAQPAAAT
jgi:hypothetical protein